MKFHRSQKGFTLIELLVVISIIAVLASLAVPAVAGALVKGQIIQAVSNSRQIHLAAMSAANDAATNGDNTYGWPGGVTGTTCASVNDYVKTLVNNGYLNVGDMKIFAAAGVSAMSGTDMTAFTGSCCAFNIYKVVDNDPSNAIFLSTRNYDANGPTLNSGTTPFGAKGYVICRKGGDAGQYKTLASGTGSYAGGTTAKLTP